MRRFFVAFAICFCCFAAHGQKTRLGQSLPHAKPGDAYPIKMHISGVHYRTSYGGIGGGLSKNMPDAIMDGEKDATYVDAIMDGQKIELQSNQNIPFWYYNLALGDHQARLLKDPHKANDAPLFREYELLLPNNTVWRCVVTGISE